MMDKINMIFCCVNLENPVNPVKIDHSRIHEYAAHPFVHSWPIRGRLPFEAACLLNPLSG